MEVNHTSGSPDVRFLWPLAIAIVRALTKATEAMPILNTFLRASAISTSDEPSGFLPEILEKGSGIDELVRSRRRSAMNMIRRSVSFALWTGPCPDGMGVVDAEEALAAPVMHGQRVADPMWPSFVRVNANRDELRPRSILERDDFPFSSSRY